MKTSIEKQLWYLHNAMENLEMYSQERYYIDHISKAVLPIWKEIFDIWNELYEKCYLKE